ncbi:recombination regulator RecX [Limosilactobacillus fastidiosus]|uniref:Regulatory protein RecX n=1 Tax=Limosilactobacillus fastidiosus TaxID=2759855 RepID=A0ABR6EB33_9LACO|nr:recombination regulator RecX [Limosilactobacillus fastidiosus]MBB1063528.1 recombination regulator RecX [Limosilactobacillus fastidiosus]MCD7084891.1 recombination regulator RecX [Limosilactobacillus fastidiosus]
MAKITKIEVQKRQGRYNVYLDGKYAFPVAESVLIQFRLMKGLEVDKELEAQITTADQIARAYSRMLDYLSHQLRTESDVIKKLRDLETPDEFIEPVLQKLRDQKLLDDHEYAASYVRTEMNTDLKGPRNIRQKLRLKRIGENDIDDALAQFTLEHQLKNATKLAKKLFRRYRSQPLQRQEQKVRQGLITKGYANSIYDQIKGQVEPQEDFEQQEKLLERQAEKLWHRYRRYAGHEREIKFKQAMYRKGFDLDAVQEWLDNHEL